MSVTQTIIVSRDLLGLLRTCVRSAAVAFAASDRAVQFVVVDNGSADPYTPAHFTTDPVEIVRLDAHGGFARCCNLAAARSTSEFILLLNNDVLLRAETVAGMVQAMADRDVGICGAGLVFPDDTIQHAGVVFGPGEIGPYHVLRTKRIPPGLGSRTEFQAVTGGCLLVRRQVFSSLNGLDESYPFGLEDVDFCLRARQRGIRVACFNAEFSLHFESLTEGRVSLDVPSRRLFMERWRGKYTIDG